MARLRFWTWRTIVGHAIEVNTWCVATAEPAFDLTILDTQVSQDTNNIRSNNGQRLVTCRGDAEQTLEIHWFHVFVAFIWVVWAVHKILISLFRYIGFMTAVFMSPRVPDLHALSPAVA